MKMEKNIRRILRKMMKKKMDKESVKKRLCLEVMTAMMKKKRKN